MWSSKMYKTKVVQKNYSAKDIEELKKISQEIKEAKKRPGFRQAIDDFIKATT